jgi:hypothetical protein
MKSVNMLREQARVLRDLASISTNDHGICDKLLVLARRCEDLAEERERALPKGDAVPLDEG